MSSLKVNIQEKKYRSKSVLENLNFTISENGIYGIIGKNGAGKTTLFKSILKEVSFNGEISFGEDEISFKRVGYCPTDPFLYNELTVKEFYAFYYYATNKKEINNDEDVFLYDVDSNKTIKALSTGMRKKVFLNCVFFQDDVDFYIFDEPFNGLDIESNLLLIKKMRTLAKTKIVLVSSHILSSMYDFCDEIYLVENKRTERFTPDQYVQLESHFV